MTNQLVVHGASVGLRTLTNLEFLPNRPYAGCRICGAIFQSDADRNPVEVFDRQQADFSYDQHNVTLFALGLRKEWSRKHANLHSEAEHQELAKSGLWATPEAAARLAAYGIFSITDILLSDEVSSALKGAPSIPDVDAEDR